MIKFANVYEECFSVVVRAEGGELVVELLCEQDGEVSERVALDPMQIAVDLDNREDALQIDRRNPGPNPLPKRGV